MQEVIQVKCENDYQDLLFTVSEDEYGTLLNKPYVNGVNLRQPNLYLKSSQSYESEVYFKEVL